MPSVLVKWETRNENRPFGSPAPDNFRIELATQTYKASLPETQHLFTNVPAGVMAGHGVTCAADGTELHTPFQFTVNVPNQPDVIVPVIIGMSGTPQ